MCTLCGNANKLSGRPVLLQAREIEKSDEKKELEQSNSSTHFFQTNSLFYDIGYFLLEAVHLQLVL